MQPVTFEKNGKQAHFVYSRSKQPVQTIRGPRLWPKSFLSLQHTDGSEMSSDDAVNVPSGTNFKQLKLEAQAAGWTPVGETQSEQETA